jgi:pimeloyl-ACP methyl ester carboxylesterase
MSTRDAIIRTVVVLALAMLQAACGERTRTPAAPAAQNGAAQAPVAEGAPRIVTSPDGVHIDFRVYGTGDPAVVLVHGWSCDANYWQAQIEPLKVRYTTVLVNLAGHGASGRTRSDWSMRSYGEDVAAVVRQLPNPRVVLVGHSMGGPVVVEAARLLPDRVIGVIGVDTLKMVGLPPIPPAETERRLAAFRTDFIGSTRTFVKERLFRPDSDPALVRKVAEDMSLAPPEVAIPSIVALEGWDAVAAFDGLTIPVVAINADLGGPTDEARIRAVVADFRAVVVPDADHFLMMSDPARVNPLLLAEIERLAAAPGT